MKIIYNYFHKDMQSLMTAYLNNLFMVLLRVAGSARPVILVGVVVRPELRLKILNYILVHLKGLCENIS